MRWSHSALIRSRNLWGNAGCGIPALAPAAAMVFVAAMGCGHIFVRSHRYTHDIRQTCDDAHRVARGRSRKGVPMVASIRIPGFVCVMAMVVAMAGVQGCAQKELQPEGSQLGPVTPGTQRDFSVNVGDIVYFSTDSTELTPEATATLRKQAQWLKQYSQFSITIEGHADERGTREYNIALGARRAQTVRNFLAQNGVNGSRIRTISYGKERPVAVCDDISCWSQNRRAQTVLNSRVSG